VRKPVLLLVVGLLATAMLSVVGTPAAHATAPAPRVSSKPNLVVIMADDMRYDDLAWAPRIRQLIADDGVTMENSFSPYPLCCPARVSFFTGQLTHNHHVWTHQRPYGYGAFDDATSLATSLQAAGYRTGLAGKYLNGYGVDATTGGRTLTQHRLRAVIKRERAIKRWEKQRLRRKGRPSVHRQKRPRPIRARLRTNARTVTSWRKVPNGWSQWHALFESSAGLRRATGVHGGGVYHYYATVSNDNGVPHSHRGTYSTDVIADDSVGMIRTFASSAAPFFLDVNFVAPHCGIGDAAERTRDVSRGLSNDTSVAQDGAVEAPCSTASPARLRGHFDSVIQRGMGITADGIDEADVSDKPGSFAALPPLSTTQLAQLRERSRQRAEAVYAMDEQVGRIIATLKRTGQWDNTYLVFTSDNGYFQGEHRRAEGKVYGYEPSLRVPMVVTGPGLRGHGAQERYDPITTVDLTATVLDWAGAAAPRTPDGTSLASVMAAGDQGWRYAVPIEEAWSTPNSGGSDPGFAGTQLASYGLRTPRYSYVRYRDGSRELYDLASDPLEWTNVATDSAYAQVVSDLDGIWQQGRTCAGSACHLELPADYQAGPDEDRALGSAWRDAVRTAYGH
jgi:arylsulfatase A-like enzyme